MARELRQESDDKQCNVWRCWCAGVGLDAESEVKMTKSATARRPVRAGGREGDESSIGLFEMRQQVRQLLLISCWGELCEGLSP